MAELVASRYASALFEAGEDLDKIQVFFEELESLKTIFEKEEGLINVLSHPKVSKREKKELIDNIFAGKISEEIINFLYILIDKNRQRDFLQMIDIYEDKYYEYKGILRVVAVTAMPMQEEAKVRLSDVLGKKLNKEILISNEVQENIIGGIKLEVEGKLIDGTIKGKLDSMAKSFRAATN